MCTPGSPRTTARPPKPSWTSGNRVSTAGNSLRLASGGSASFSPSQRGRLAGSCYLFLRDAKSAAGIVEAAAQALQDQSKSQAVVLGNLANAHIRLGARRGGCQAEKAIDVTERNGGGGGLTIICSAGRHLRRWRDRAEVQDVYDRIMALMAA